jgi:hypothetical protein
MHAPSRVKPAENTDLRRHNARNFPNADGLNARKLDGTSPRVQEKLNSHLLASMIDPIARSRHERSFFVSESPNSALLT